MANPMIWAALISAAGSAYSANQQKKSMSQMSNKELQRLITQGIAKQQPWGERMMARGETALGDALGYYKPLLSGDRTSMMESLSPEMLARDDQYAGAHRAAMEIAPRSGAAASTMANLPFQKMRDETTALFNLRRGAAGDMAQLGTNMSSLGQSAITGGASAGLGLLGHRRNESNDQWDRDTQMGASLVGLVNSLPWQQWQNRSGKTEPLPTTSTSIPYMQGQAPGVAPKSATPTNMASRFGSNTLPSVSWRIGAGSLTNKEQGAPSWGLGLMAGPNGRKW